VEGRNHRTILVNLAVGKWPEGVLEGKVLWEGDKASQEGGGVRLVGKGGTRGGRDKIEPF